MTLIKLADLSSTFVPFIARKVNSDVLWSNSSLNLNLKQLVHDTSYIIPKEENLSIYRGGNLHSVEKVFYAERYGGDAIGYHGGGARCGFDGKWQIKGIGPNPLVGEGAKQVNGELTLNGAVLEIIWNSLMNKLLPWGVVTNIAILMTDQNVENNDTTLAKSINNRRTLLIREPAIRPAHFCRAPIYRPHRNMFGYLNDTARVKELIKKLIQCLPLPEFLSRQESEKFYQEELALYGLIELADRLATQIAVCRTRYIAMFTSASNCDMNGRLLDFHGVRSVFPSDRPSSVGKSYIQYNKLISDAPLLLQGVHDLAFYLAKYCFDNDFLLVAKKQISNTFYNSYQQTCWKENLAIVGFDYSFLQNLSLDEEYLSLGTRLQNIYDLSGGIFTQQLTVSPSLISPHPAISLISKLIDSVALNEVLPTKNKCTANQRFNFNFQRLFRDYIKSLNLKGKCTKNIPSEMKNTVERRLQSRKFMTREAIYEEISSWKGNIFDIKNQLEDYQVKFVNKASYILCK